MFLVAGLAVAGLAGIAAAFYFSIRSGNRDKGLRSAGAGHAETGRRPGSGSVAARPDLIGHSGGAANGGRPLTTFTPAAASPRKPRAEQARAADSRPDDSRPEDPLPEDAHAADGGADTARPRRRVGFRKGADLDEELWPAETFGGVSDEQFWDDLASDKPLATTARTAQASPGRNRPAGGAPGTRLDAGDDRTPGRGTRSAGTGMYAAPLTPPDPAAERTAIQPAYAATQPIQSMKSQLPGVTQPVRVAASTSQPHGAPTQPTQPAQTQPAQTQPAQTRRRRPSSAEEDPLTSAAFSLRPSGPVDGRSSFRAQSTPADRYDRSSPYLYPAPTYRDSSSVTQAMATPPSGQDYGYRPGNPAAQAGEPRRHSGTRSHARPDGGSQGSGGYPGNGHRGNGHRAPYDPRDDYRRLTPQR